MNVLYNKSDAAIFRALWRVCMDQVSANKPRGLDATTIKIIAIVGMLIDHVGATIIERLLYDYNVLEPLYYAMRIIGRISFPIFCFFIVEGFVHTRCRWKYALRLLVFAIVSEIPFDMAIYKEFFYFKYQNVYFTLLFGLLVIWAIDALVKITPKLIVKILFVSGACIIPTLYVTNEIYALISIFYENIINIKASAYIIWAVIAVIMLIWLVILGLSKPDKSYKASVILTLVGLGMLVADYFMTDYSSKGIVVIALMYLMRQWRLASLITSGVYLGLANFAEFPALFSVPIIKAYNGTRGKGMKYFFYAFYPVHLLILGIIVKLLF